jgi:hypothetical protein
LQQNDFPFSRFPVSGLLKGCKGHKTHRFENGGTNQIRKTGKREVVLLQPLPQTLYLLRKPMQIFIGVLITSETGIDTDVFK